MVELDPRTFQIPLYCPPMDIGVASVPSNENLLNQSPLKNPFGLPISPLLILYQHPFLFHQDLITWNISLAQTQKYVQCGTIRAAPWPNTEFPKTILYWSVDNEFGCNQLQHISHLILQGLSKIQQTGQHFLSYQSIYNELQQQLVVPMPSHAVKDYLEPTPKPNRMHLTQFLAGLIYTRTIGTLEEVTHTGYELLRPPLYFDPHDEEAIEMLRNSFQANRMRNENKRKQRAEEEGYKAGSSITG